MTTLETSERLDAPELLGAQGGWSLGLRAAWFQNRRAIFGWAAVVVALAIYMVFTMWRFDVARDAVNAHCATPADLSTNLCLKLYRPYDRWANAAANSVLVAIGYILPALVGILLGLGAVDVLEQQKKGRFLWTQGVSRTRWIGSQAAVLVPAVIVICGAAAALFNWWVAQLPRVATVSGSGFYREAFTKGTFDISGTVMIGYGLFALALGLFFGVGCRRALALVGSLISFLFVRIGVYLWRQSYIDPAVKIASSPASPAGLRLPSRALINAQGLARIGQTRIIQGSSYVSRVMGRCDRVVAPPSPPMPPAVGTGGVHIVTRISSSVSTPYVPGLPTTKSTVACFKDHGLHWVTLYQPPSRFWSYQGIETGLFLVFAAALMAGAVFVVRRRNV